MSRRVSVLLVLAACGGTADAARAPFVAERTPLALANETPPPERAPPAEQAAEDPPPPPVDPTLLQQCAEQRAIVVFKARRELELRCGDAVAGRYGISLGFAPNEPKRREGDGRTPEGAYLITHKFASQFHLSLQVAYPNADDAALGLEAGTIDRRQHDAIVAAVKGCRTPPQNTGLGSLIQVHGAGGGPEHGDWTLGCVALNNSVIEAVAAFHQPGCTGEGEPRTPLQILP